MTNQQKRRFIRELVDSVRNTLQNDVPRMPDEWDGNELRELIADRFHRERNPLAMALGSRRYKEFANDVLVRNL